MNLLSYLYEEGMKIEPEHYVPILPMVLVNGAEGIATGYSTFIPQFNPLDIIEALKEKMKGNSFPRLRPYYKGFEGKFIDSGSGYSCEGNCYIKDDTHDPILVIDELPVQKWTKDYKVFLESLIEEEVIEDMREYHTHNRVKFELLIPSLSYIENMEGGLMKFFKLTSSFSTANYVLYDHTGKIRRYEDE